MGPDTTGLWHCMQDWFPKKKQCYWIPNHFRGNNKHRAAQGLILQSTRKRVYGSALWLHHIISPRHRCINHIQIWFLQIHSSRVSPFSIHPTFLSQPLAAQKSSWLQVVMGGSWVEDWELTTNTPGKHGVFQIYLYRVMIHPFGENQKFLHNFYQERGSLNTLKGSQIQPQNSQFGPHENIPMKSGATSQASPVQWRTGADAGYRSDSLAVELLETLAIFNEVESHPFNQWRSTTFAAKWHLTSLLNYVEKRVTWIGLSNRSYEPSSCIMDAASSLVKIWGPIAVTSPFH